MNLAMPSPRLCSCDRICCQCRSSAYILLCLHRGFVAVTFCNGNAFGTRLRLLCLHRGFVAVTKRREISENAAGLAMPSPRLCSCDSWSDSPTKPLRGLLCLHCGFVAVTYVSVGATLRCAPLLCLHRGFVAVTEKQRFRIDPRLAMPSPRFCCSDLWLCPSPRTRLASLCLHRGFVAAAFFIDGGRGGNPAL